MILALIHDIRKLALNPNANAIDINQKISEFNGFDFSSHPRTLNKSTKEVPIIPPFKRQRKELPLDAASAEPKKSCFLDREAFEALREIKLDDFSYLLHNLSLLSEKSEILINATQISIVAIALIISKGESSAKFISIGISALGNLAKTNKIEGRLDEGFFQPLLTELLMLRPTARDISRAIYALGELAKNKQINLPFANCRQGQYPANKRRRPIRILKSHFTQ